MAFEVDVDLLALDRSAAVLDDHFAQAFHEQNGPWRVDRPVGGDRHALDSFGAAGGVDDPVRPVQRPFFTADFA